MDHLTRAHSSSGRIDLAHEADFAIGPLRVSPSRCEVAMGDMRRAVQRRVMQVLVALARPEAEVVSQDELIRRCWGGLSVGDDAIGRCIGQLRRLAGGLPRPTFEIETIAGVGYRLKIQGPSDVAADDQADAAAKPRRWRLAPALGATLVAALALVAGLFALESRHSTGKLGRVAVQPFEVLSPGQQGRFLADSVADDVVDVLAANQVETLSRHDAPTSTKGVRLRVSGSVQLEGAQAKVIVRLDDARTGVTVWSADFEGSSAADSSLGEEVATRTADTVEMAQYALAASPPLKDDAALSAYLEAHNLIRWNRSRDWPRLIADTQKVTALAPDFAFGHSMLALANGYAVRSLHPPGEAALIETGRREAARALELDPKDASAYYALSTLVDGYPAREAVLLKGIAADGHPPIPYAAVNNTEGELLMTVGREHDAVSYISRSVALDPLSAVKVGSLVRAYEGVGQIGEARDLIDQSIKRWPHHPDLQMSRLIHETFYGDPAAASALLQNPATRPAMLPPPAIAAWQSYLAAGKSSPSRRQAALEVAAAADAHSLRRPLAMMMLAKLGDLDQAFDQARKGVAEEQMDPRSLFLPPTAAMRGDARFWPLAEQLGLSDYWRRSGKLPDFCAAEGVDCQALRSAPATRG